MNRKRVYISGKISGMKPDEYRANFAFAEFLLREAGYRTVNPTRFAISRYSWLYRLLGYRLVLLMDLWVLDKYCDMIYFIPGWSGSVGACIESDFAFHRGIDNLPTEEARAIDEKIMALMLANMSNYKTNNNGRR